MNYKMIYCEKKDILVDNSLIKKNRDKEVTNDLSVVG